MKLQLPAILATLLVVAQAAPGSVLTARDSINDCGDSTFENDTSDASPDVSDCDQIVTNISGGGHWTGSGSQRTLVSYGTCALGINGNVGKIGNQDIMDVIKESVARFSNGGDKVGAHGKMECQSNTGMGNQHVEWSLYHT